MPRVVQHLHLGSGPVDGFVVLARAVEDPAVAPRRDVPLERELEVAELLARDDVAGRRDAGERAVDDLPSGRHRVHLEATPAGSRLAVEQQPPARGALGGGQGLGRLVVQGGLTTGLLHALVAMDLPGPGTVFLSQNWKFTAPVYLGDTITAEAEVVSVHPTKPVCQLRVVIKREDGEMVLEGEAWCYTLAAKDDPS